MVNRFMSHQQQEDCTRRQARWPKAGMLLKAKRKNFIHPVRTQHVTRDYISYELDVSDIICVVSAWHRDDGMVCLEFLVFNNPKLPVTKKFKTYLMASSIKDRVYYWFDKVEV